MPAFISPDLWPPNSPDLTQPSRLQDLGTDAKSGLPEKSEGRERVGRCRRPVAHDACMPVFGLEEDILSICCDCISYT